MMEPAAYGASVMFGPHIANFRDTVDQLLERNAARQVADAEELTRGPARRPRRSRSGGGARGAPARSFVLAQNGAAGRTLRPSSTGLSNRHTLFEQTASSHRLAFSTALR